jgi:hypothetical protein
MSKQKLLTPCEKAQIATQYKAGGVSQEDLGIIYGVSATTIRRTLYEFGLCTFNSEVTQKERSLLDVIKQYGISTAEQLRSVLAKGVQCQ